MCKIILKIRELVHNERLYFMPSRGYHPNIHIGRCAMLHRIHWCSNQVDSVKYVDALNIRAPTSSNTNRLHILQFEDSASKKMQNLPVFYLYHLMNNHTIWPPL